jgi:phosphatidylinositol 3-kinase
METSIVELLGVEEEEDAQIACGIDILRKHLTLIPVVASMSGNKFRFFLSCDINSPVAYQVDKLEGKLFTKSFSEGENCIENLTPELYVECALYIDGASFGLPTRTRLEPTGKPNCLNEFSELSAKYRYLTADAQLAFTVWDVSSVKKYVVIGGATFYLFNRKKQLKTR